MTQVENLNLYFVLPFENAEEEHCSAEMKTALQVVLQYGGKAELVQPSFCLDHVPGKNDVFIFEKFEGTTFEELKKHSAKILGVPCMLTCTTDGRSIPPGVSPVFTEGMRGLFVCCTGFEVKRRKIIQQRVEYMGGIFDRTLRSATTHIIAHKNITDKAIGGYKNKIPVMKYEWVEAVWNKSLSSNVNGKDGTFNQYLSPLFHNLKITVSGLPKREKEKLKEAITNHGGTFTSSMESQSTDILLISKPEGEKFKYAQEWKIFCILPKWIEDCINSKAILELADYYLRSKIPKASTPKRDEVNLTNNFSMMSNIGYEPDKKITHLDETSLSLSCATNRSHFQMPYAVSQANNKPAYADVIDNVLLKDVKDSGQFLDGCNIFLAGFNAEYSEKLKKIFNKGGATRFNDLTGCVTHIIIGNKKEGEIESMQSYGAYILSLDWVVESMQLKRPAPENQFLLADNVPNPSEPPSPLTKQGAKLLSKDNRSVQKLDLDQSHKPTENIEDLLVRYNLSQPGEPLQQPEYSSVASNVSNATRSSTASDSDKYFKDLIFYLSSELKEAAEVKELIEANGGQVIGKRFSGVPDYAVVSITGASLTEMTAKEIVSLFFIKDCAQQGCVVPIQYYHLPVAYVRDSMPLRDCVITLSNYVDLEREFIEFLVENLGAILQHLLARRQVPNALKTTHLICAEPTGEKYKGAIRWGVPVVHHNWLLKCASSGARISERPYLVGESKLGDGEPLPSPSSVNQTSQSLQSPHPNIQTNTTIVHPAKTATIIPSSIAHKDSPVHSAITRLKMMETPKAEGSTDSNRTITPTSPYGAFYGKNPSPGTRKRLDKWMHQGVEFPQDSPTVKAPESNRRNSTPLSQVLSRYLVQMKRKSDDTSPESPEETPLKRLNLTDKEIESEQNQAVKTNLDISTGLQKMKEIEQNYAKNCAKPTTSIRKSHENLHPQMLIVAESQQHTEVGWEDPSQKEIALGQLENNVKKELPTKLFMVSNLDEDIDVVKKLIEESGGKMSPLPHFDKTATHIIIRSMCRGEKLMGSIAAGLWVLHPSYLNELRIARNVHAVSEEDFEWGNPKKTSRLNSLPSTAKEFAQCSYTWRNLLKNNEPPPFKDMKIILNLSETKHDAFKRLLEAGGGEIVNVKPPYSGNIDATICICDATNGDKIDMESLAKQRISCVTLVFISDHILRKGDCIEKYFIPGFAKYWD